MLKRTPDSLLRVEAPAGFKNSNTKRPLRRTEDTRHLVCRPTHLLTTMAHSGALAPAPFRLRARLFHNSSQPRGV